MQIAIHTVLTEASIAYCYNGFINKLYSGVLKIKGLGFDVSRLIIYLFGGCILGQITSFSKLCADFYATTLISNQLYFGLGNMLAVRFFRASFYWVTDNLCCKLLVSN